MRLDDGAHLGRGRRYGGLVFGRGEELLEFGDGVVGGDFGSVDVWGVREEGGDVEAGEGFGCFAVAFAAAEFRGDCVVVVFVRVEGMSGSGWDWRSGLAFLDGCGGYEFLKVGSCF